MSADGFISATADNILNAFGNNTTWTAGATLFVKLHTGFPGSAGTSNAAGNTSQQSLSFGNSSGGTMTNDVALTWTSVSTSETYSHFSIWSTSNTSGTCYATGSVSASAVTAGDTFTIAIGGLSATVSVAA